MTERATAAPLRYLERRLAGANTTWAAVQRRWPDAPVRFDQLDQQRAGALIATLRRHAPDPADGDETGHRHRRPTEVREKGLVHHRSFFA